MGIVSAFKTTGSVLPKPPIKKQPCEKREEAKNQLKDMVADSATFSSRKASSALGISQTLVLSILHDDLHLKPYKHHKWHKLEVHDYEKRVEFATWFLSLAAQVKFFFYFSDEAYFYLTQPINSQNNRIWAEEQPLEGVEMPLHDKKVLVWCRRDFGRGYHRTLLFQRIGQQRQLPRDAQNLFLASACTDSEQHEILLSARRRYFSHGRHGSELAKGQVFEEIRTQENVSACTLPGFEPL
jgi:hypothetical protein